MTAHNTLGALVALASAASWGGGDFSGGMGVKASEPGSVPAALRFVITSYAVSLLPLTVVLLLFPEPLAHGAPLLWALAGGIAGCCAITAFYIALSRGSMGPAAAVSGLLAAAIPVLVSVLTEGRPHLAQGVGFLLAAVAITLISAQPTAGSTRSTMGLAIGGGIGFGVYFVTMRYANAVGVFEPMLLARLAGIVTGLVLLGCMRALPQPWIVARPAWKWVAGVALLDTGGNLFFLLATRIGRLDVAAVLASLYPAGTILLAAWRLQERPTRSQLLGMTLALVAVVLITL